MTKGNILLGFILTLSATLAIYSCSKEYSCEDCYRQAPVAKAGEDQFNTIPNDSALLDGSTSYDADGVIVQWQWKKIAGPANIAVTNQNTAIASVYNLTGGVYEFELTITDDDGLPGKDTMQLIVDDPGINQPPVARAGNDTTIILPANSSFLNGNFSFDPDNNISSYNWTKIAGPSSYNIQNTGASQTMLTGLVEGTYLLELKVTDAGGLYSQDTVLVSVVTPIPPCSTCNLVFVSARDGNNEIYKCKADGSNLTRLTNNAANEDDPAWSPDGTQIAFVSNRSGDYELYIMQADGSNVVQKTFLSRNSDHPSWSPDGTEIAFSSFQNGSMNIWILNVLTSATYLIYESPFWEGQPSWSPSGQEIAISSNWRALDQGFNLWGIGLPGYSAGPKTSVYIIDSLNYFNPSWAPDNRKLAFAIDKKLGNNNITTRIGIMNFWDTIPIPLISGAFPSTRTAWSQDGNRIAYTSLPTIGTQPNISWVAANGSSSGLIITNGWNADW